MARLARVVIPEVPHHVTQRDNRREPIFFEPADVTGMGIMSPYSSLWETPTSSPTSNSAWAARSPGARQGANPRRRRLGSSIY